MAEPNELVRCHSERTRDGAELLIYCSNNSVDNNTLPINPDIIQTLTQIRNYDLFNDLRARRSDRKSKPTERLSSDERTDFTKFTATGKTITKNRKHKNKVKRQKFKLNQKVMATFTDVKYGKGYFPGRIGKYNSKNDQYLIKWDDNTKSLWVHSSEVMIP